MQNIYLIRIKLDHKWTVSLHMKAQQYLGFKESNLVTSSSYHAEIVPIYDVNRVCLIGIMIYHIQKNM